MHFQVLAQYFHKLEGVSSRLQLRDILIELFNQLDFKEQQIVSYFLQGRLAPPFVSLEFNISEKTIDRYIQERFRDALNGKDFSQLKVEHKDSAGVYEYLYNLKRENVSSSVTIEEVYKQLVDIALIEGSGAVLKRKQKLNELLHQLDATSGKYILRLILGRLRLGVSVRTLLDALAHIEFKKNGGDKSSLKKMFDRAYGLTSDIGYITGLYFKKGVDAVRQVTFTPGVPVAPQLAEREKSLEACLRRIPHPVVDPKLDGLRGQIHIFSAEFISEDIFNNRVWFEAYQKRLNRQVRGGGLLSRSGNDLYVKIFSRNLEDLTPMFPEIQQFVNDNADVFSRFLKGQPIEAVVFDSELIGFNEVVGEFYGFQTTMKRRRKYGISAAMKEIPIKAFVFDVIFFGKELLDTQLLQRRKHLEEIFAALPKDGTMILNIDKVFDKSMPKEKVIEEVHKMFYDYVSRGLEGIMIKDPDSPYEPGVRKFTWIKFKRAMKHELADTLDVVVLGYYYGKGRLATLGIGGLLVGVYDPQKDEYLTITKVGTGLTDSDWLKLKAILDGLKVDKKPLNVKVSKELEPDVLVYPELVIEVEADEITRSPIHTAGVALRFPRFKRIREDKSATDATTIQEVLEMMGMGESGP